MSYTRTQITLPMPVDVGNAIYAYLCNGRPSPMTCIFLSERKRRTFHFEDCTHDLLLEFLHHPHERGNAETTCNNRLAAIRVYNLLKQRGYTIKDDVVPAS